MPGGRQTSLTNPVVVRMFRHALTQQTWWILLGAAVVASGMLLWQWRRPLSATLEPRARTYLRWSFGLFWMIDGVLQLQPSMPLGLANDVVAPSALGTPIWLHHLVLSGVGIWNQHPLALATATAWMELGIGLLLLSARGRLSRVAGAASAGWGLVVWVAGNALGGIFSTNTSILFGWPGAALFYVTAGFCLALPEKFFNQSFSRVTLRATAALLVVATLVQAWPDHEFWHGGPTNALTAMTTSMTKAPQPSLLMWIVNHFGAVGSQLGGGFNIVVILWLLICAVGLWRASSNDSRWPFAVLLTGAGLIWVVAQDAAFFGGLSTDLNSMWPLGALVWCAAPRRRTAAPREPLMAKLDLSGFALAGRALGSAMFVAAVIPMVAATVSNAAETTRYLAMNPYFTLINAPAPPFTLTDQRGQKFHFPVNDGRFTVLTFLDPTCSTDCPLLAHQLEQLSAALTPRERSRVTLLAVAGNPYHESVVDLRRFMTREYLDGLTNFKFVTGPLTVISNVWANYGVQISMRPTDAMSVHSDFMYIIDPAGRERVIVPDDPAAGWSGELSTTTALLQALHDAGLN